MDADLPESVWKNTVMLPVRRLSQPGLGAGQHGGVGCLPSLPPPLPAAGNQAHRATSCGALPSSKVQIGQLQRRQAQSRHQRRWQRAAVVDSTVVDTSSSVSDELFSLQSAIQSAADYSDLADLTPHLGNAFDGFKVAGSDKESEEALDLLWPCLVHRLVELRLEKGTIQQDSPAFKAAVSCMIFSSTYMQAYVGSCTCPLQMLTTLMEYYKARLPNKCTPSMDLKESILAKLNDAAFLDRLVGRHAGNSVGTQQDVGTKVLQLSSLMVEAAEKQLIVDQPSGFLIWVLAQPMLSTEQRLHVAGNFKMMQDAAGKQAAKGAPTASSSGSSSSIKTSYRDSAAGTARNTRPECSSSPESSKGHGADDTSVMASTSTAGRATEKGRAASKSRTSSPAVEDSSLSDAADDEADMSYLDAHITDFKALAVKVFTIEVTSKGKVRLSEPPPLPSNITSITGITEYVQELEKRLSAATKERNHQQPGLKNAPVFLVMATGRAYSCAVASALVAAAELWQGEVLPAASNIQALENMANQLRAGALLGDSDDDGSETEEEDDAVSGAGEEDEEEDGLVDEESDGDDNDDDDEEEEEEEEPANDASGAQKELQELLTSARQVLTKLGRPADPAALERLLWAIAVLQAPLLTSHIRLTNSWNAWKGSILNKLQELGKQVGAPDKSVAGEFLSDAEAADVVPSLLLAMRTLNFERTPAVLPLASHSVTQMSSRTWGPSASRVALKSLLQLMPKKEKDMANQLLGAFGDIIVEARNNAIEDAPSLAGWLITRAPKSMRAQVFATLVSTVRRLPLRAALLITQLTLSPYGGLDEEDMSERERKQLNTTRKAMISALSMKATMSSMGPGIKVGLATLDTPQLVQLAELNATQKVQVRGKWKDDCDKELQVKLCQELSQRLYQTSSLSGRPALEVDMLFTLCRVLLRTKAVHNDGLLTRKVIEEASRRLHQLDGDALALCVLRQADPIEPLAGDAHSLFNSTMREARAKLRAMSVTGLLTVLCGISMLNRDVDLPQYNRDVDGVCDLLVSKLGNGTFEDEEQVRLAASALLEMRHYHAPLLRKLIDASNSKECLENMSLAVINRLLYCLAMLAPEMKGVQDTFRAAAQHVAPRLHRLRLRELSNVSWAFAVCNQNCNVTMSKTWLSKRKVTWQLIQKLCAKAEADDDEDDSSAKKPAKKGSKPLRGNRGDGNNHRTSIAQLIVAELTHRQSEIAKEIEDDQLALAGSIKYALRIWSVLQPNVQIPKKLHVALKDLSGAGLVSGTQKSVIGLLKSSKALGLSKVVSEANIGHHWVVDASAKDPKNDVRFVFEVDGPLHYTNNTPRKQLGSTWIRNRCINAIIGKGGKLVVINLYDMPMDSERTTRATEAYIQRRIKEALKSRD